MSYYTRFYFSALLKNDTPGEVLTVIEELAKGKYPNTLNHEEPHSNSSRVFTPRISHPFLENQRCSELFTYYFIGDKNSGTKLIQHDSQWALTIKSVVNYGSEVIGLFLDFIKPYVDKREDKEHLGHYIDEGGEPKMYIYLDCNDNIIYSDILEFIHHDYTVTLETYNDEDDF